MRANKAQITLFFFLLISSVAVINVNTRPSPPVIQVVPKISTAALGETFTVNITVADVTIENSDNGVYGWEFDMSFNASIIEVVDIIEGPWLKTGGDTTWNKVIDNDNGIVIGTSFFSPYPEEGVVGSGILANVTFHVLGMGAFPLLLYKTLLRTFNWDTSQIEPIDHTAENGFFSNVHDIAIISLTPSDTQVNEGDLVDIDVVVANEGDFDETFDVTTYWNIGSSAWRGVINETKTGIQLENGTSTSPPLRFTWDTTDRRAGTYTISAEASVVAGEMNTIDNTKIDGQVTVGDSIANFTYSPKHPSVNEKVTFTSTIDPNVTVVSLEWDFDGDGTLDASEENVTYTYTEAGNYTAILFVTHDEGNESFSYESIRVMINPVANFTHSPTEKFVRQPVTFDASTSEDEDGEIVTYEWDFGDENKTTVTHWLITHTYVQEGNYTVTLTVTDNDDLSDSIAKNVTVKIKHDVAVVRIYRLVQGEKVDIQREYYAGDPIDMYGDVLNNGTETETFSVAAYYDNSNITTLEVAHLVPVDQAPNNIRNVSLLWDTRGVSDGKYNITVEAILGADEDLSNNKATVSVTLKPRPDVAIANLTVSSTRVLANDQLNVTVVVKNEGKTYETPIIRLELKNATSPSFPNDAKPVDPVPLEPGTEGTWTLSWNVSRDVPPGNYTLSAEAELANDDDEDNKLVYGEITVGASDISISASPETITLGSRTTVSGSITPVRPNVNVTMHYRIIGNDTWSILENVTTTDGNGTYSYDWRPQATGTYEVMTSWKGDNNTLPSKSETLTIIVNPAIPILLYGFAAVAIAAIIIAVAIYFFKIRKPKPA